MRQAAGGEDLAHTRLHLGVSELALGEVEEARSELEAALKGYGRESDPRRRALAGWALAQALPKEEEARAIELKKDANANLQSGGRRFKRELEEMNVCLRARSSADH